MAIDVVYAVSLECAPSDVTEVLKALRDTGFCGCEITHCDGNCLTVSVPCPFVRMEAKR